MVFADEFFAGAEIIVIYDTEFTTWEGALERNWSDPNEHRELVQIAAQKVHLPSRSVIDQFERLVLPRINREVSPYFTALTNITQVQLESSGIDFARALAEFEEWRGGATAYSYSKRVDDYTDANVLRENLRLYELNQTIDPAAYQILTPLFQVAGVDTMEYNSGKLYQAFGLQLAAHHEHNAMDDVHSLVASLCAALERLKSQQ